jgi:fumarate reductase flavoprotein subunit
MVERCADCGFDLAGDRVEVIPTAHYMMGGVEFQPDSTTALPGLYAAGEDTGGVHGANRLGGNGVANSTVFGGIAGDTMAGETFDRPWSEPDERAIDRAVARCQTPLNRPPGDLSALRDGLHRLMWDDAGILRDAEGLNRAETGLAELAVELHRTGISGVSLAFNLTWHDWLNLDSLILVSRSIVAAAKAREDSQGAHFRSDFPESGDPRRASYTRVALDGDDLVVERSPVRFSRVEPGRSLLSDAA